MTREEKTLLEILDMLSKRIEKEDEMIHIKDKNGLAYELFNKLEEEYPAIIRDVLNEFD